MLAYSGAKVQSRFYPGDLVTRTRSVSGRLPDYRLIIQNSWHECITLWSLGIFTETDPLFLEEIGCCDTRANLQLPFPS